MGFAAAQPILQSRAPGFQAQKGRGHVRNYCRRRYRGSSQVVEGRQPCAAVGEQARTPAGAAAGASSPLGLGADPSTDRRRHLGRLAGGGRAACAATDPAAPDQSGGTTDFEHASRQSPDFVAWREGASAPPHDECIAIRDRGVGRTHDRGRQAVSDGGGRSDPDPGVDLARARAPGPRSDHMARRARRAVAPPHGYRILSARSGHRAARHDC